jgi:glycosyltransferase involved in cell wall biosynthesis
MVPVQKILDKLDFVILGSEESCAVNDFGYRPLIFARELSRSGRVGKVLIINCPISLPRRMINAVKSARGIERFYDVISKNMMASMVKINDKLFMLNLTSVLPESNGRILRAESDMHYRNIFRALKNIGFDDFILWIVTPRIIDIAMMINSRLKVFDAIDDLRAHPQMKKYQDRIEKAYRRIEDNVDLICIASSGQHGMFSDTAKTFLMSNGVDRAFLKFTGAIPPADIENLPRPIIGYVGVVQERINVNLMEEVARLLPDHTFVFVGPVRNSPYFGALMRHKNVHFLGIKPYAQIPAYISSFNICMIPHEINVLTESMDPIKIYEYLACGKAIVSTSVAGTERFRELIYLANDAKAFSESIKQALSEVDEELPNRRKLAAAQCSWNNVILKLLSRIDMVLKLKG